MYEWREETLDGSLGMKLTDSGSYKTIKECYDSVNHLDVGRNGIDSIMFPKSGVVYNIKEVPNV